MKKKERKSCCRAENQGNLGVGGIMALLGLEMLWRRNGKKKQNKATRAKRSSTLFTSVIAKCRSFQISLCGKFDSEP